VEGMAVVHGRGVTTSLRAERSNPWQRKTWSWIASSLARRAMTAETR
jgi:hypothetical protein